MITSNIELYELLQEKMGSLEAKALIEFIQQEVEHQVELKKDSLVTKEVTALIKEDMHLSRPKIRNQGLILRQEIEQAKIDLIKTIYYTSLIQFLAVTTAFWAILKYIH